MDQKQNTQAQTGGATTSRADAPLRSDDQGKTYFAAISGFIVTANADGSIPLNAKFVTRLSDDANGPLVARLLSQANATPDLLSALISLEQAYTNKHSPQHRAACLSEARAAIASATQG